MRARLDTPLKRVLEADGRRQDWLAAKVGASKQQVWTWVHGLHVPTEPTRERIACALGRDVADLWPDEQDMREAA